jgi:hypothetical protein
MPTTRNVLRPRGIVSPGRQLGTALASVGWGNALLDFGIGFISSFGEAVIDVIGGWLVDELTDFVNNPPDPDWSNMPSTALPHLGGPGG